jgi:hypothetical protein
MRQCLSYKPAFGTSAPVSDLEFVDRYAADFFYNSVGLAIKEMYVAHKAAGGITSFYRQLGVSCEALTQSVFVEELGIVRENVRWSYQLATGGSGDDRTLTLDARLAPSEVQDIARRQKIQGWLLSAASAVNIEPDIAGQLKGAVFEVRQGYKSADSKRQNADLGFGIHALKAGYLPCLLVFSGQVSESVVARYRNAGLYVLLGSSSAQAHMDTRDFFRDVIGWDLVKWLDTNGVTIRNELELIVKYLLS